MHRAAVTRPRPCSPRLCRASPSCELHQVDRALEAGRAQGALCCTSAQLSVGKWVVRAGASGGAAHLGMMSDVEPWCTSTRVRRAHSGASLSCTWTRCASPPAHVLHLAETPQRWRHRCVHAICERVGASAAALDRYTCARVLCVPVVARQRASCAGADAVDTASRVGSSPGVTIFTVWRAKLEIKGSPLGFDRRVFSLDVMN